MTLLKVKNMNKPVRVHGSKASHNLKHMQAKINNFIILKIIDNQFITVF